MMDDEERELIAAIVAGDLSSRAIYADWLEQHGRPDEAQWIYRYDPERAMMTYDEPLAVLATRLDPKWRMVMGRPFVQDCVQRPCPRDWGSMTAHDDGPTRTCPNCNLRIRYCFAGDDSRTTASDRHVLDILYQRHPI